MKTEELEKTVNRLDIDIISVANLKNLFPQSRNLKMEIKRLVDRGKLKHLHRGFYCLSSQSPSIEKIASNIYYPSYVSFESALSQYGIIDQGSFQLTLATTRHSRQLTLDNRICIYRRIKSDIYFGFNLIGDHYIAEAEKALLDYLYFTYLGKLKPITSNFYLKDINRAKFISYAKIFGPKTLSFFRSFLV